MRWLVRIGFLCLFVVLVAIALAFMNANADDYQLKFYDWTLIQNDVGVIVLLAFGLGALVGLLVWIPFVLSLRRQTKRMQKRLAEKQSAEQVKESVI